METETFTTEDLVSFGNYLLSEERMDRVDYVGVVHDADLANWRDGEKAKQPGE